MKKIKILCLYQVVMHYRIPFYQSLSSDSEYDFTLVYGKGKKNTKLVNANFDKNKINAEYLFDFRIPIKINGSESNIPFSPFLIFKLIFKSPDVVFTEGSSSLINSSIAFIYTKIFRKKIIWWSLGNLENKKKYGFRKLIGKWEQIIEKNCDAIFTYSNQGRKYFLSRGIDESKVFVGLNVLDTKDKIKEIEELKKSDCSFEYNEYFNICFIGTLTKEKKLDLLFDTLKKFNEKNNNIARLHIIGDGSEFESIKSYVNQLKMNGHIVFYGRLTKGISRILYNCQVMVLPGLGGLAICEGMINSLPIISGVADGTELDLISDENGFVLRNINSELLLEKLEFLFKNPEICEKMGQHSFHKITENFSFDKYYLSFKNTLKHSITKR